MEHNKKDKKIKVFGESTVSLSSQSKIACFLRSSTLIAFFPFQAFGKADHSISVEKLKTVYSDYEVTWSDDKK